MDTCQTIQRRSPATLEIGHDVDERSLCPLASLGGCCTILVASLVRRRVIRAATAPCLLFSLSPVTLVVVVVFPSCAVLSLSRSCSLRCGLLLSHHVFISPACCHRFALFSSVPLYYILFWSDLICSKEQSHREMLSPLEQMRAKYKKRRKEAGSREDATMTKLASFASNVRASKTRANEDTEELKVPPISVL